MLAALVACKDKSNDVPAPKAAEAANVASGGASGVAPAAADSAPDTSGKKGIAYIGVEGTGLVRLAGGKIKTLIEHQYPIYDIAVGPRGVAYAAAIGGLWSIHGDKVESLPAAAEFSDHQKVAVSSDGILWTISHSEAYRWDGKAWTSVPKATFGDELLYDITVDKSGRPWVASSDHLYRLDGGAWTTIDNKFTGTKQPFFKTVVAGPAGEVYVAGSPGVFEYEGDAWKKVAMTASDSFLTPDELAVGPDGRVAGSSGLDEVALRAPDGTAKMLRLPRTGAKAKQADVMAVDAAGRTWLRSDNGVVILDGDGTLVQQWLPGTVAGITGKIQAIAVVGEAGLPELGTAARGTVTGKVLFNGKPVVGAAVEICTSPSSLMMTEKTPCTGSSQMKTAVTGDDGTFTMKDVAVGSYGIAIKPKKTWFVTWGTDQCCNTLEDGGTFDIGSLKLDKLE